MNAVFKQIEEIKRVKNAISNSNSIYLIKDYSKHLKKLTKDLQIYCKFKGYNYKKISKKFS